MAVNKNILNLKFKTVKYCGTTYPINIATREIQIGKKACVLFYFKIASPCH